MGNGISSGKVQCHQGHQSTETNLLILYPERTHTQHGGLHTVPWSGEQSSMSWNRHMDQAVKKANSTPGFLRRNLRISNEQTKSAAYFSMVRQIIESCSTVWSPHTKEYVSKVEMVQRRAATYVTNRYCSTSSVTSMLDHLDWESLEACRAKTQLTMLFKIIHGLVDIPAVDYLVPASTRTRSQHSLKFLQIPVSSDYFKFSFFPITIFVVKIPYQPLWLRLPVWYLSNGSYSKSVNLSCLARQLRNTLVIPSSYAVGDFVCPGTLREGSLVED